MTFESENFYIIGHRGAAGDYTENSLQGFRHVLTLGIDGIEIDIREHGSELWVFHDHDIARLTDGEGLFEDQADIGALRLGNQEPIPTLRQVLDLAWGKLPLNIEIKAVDQPRLLLQLLDEYPAIESPAPGLPWILISSFDHAALIELRRLNCRWPLAPISSGKPEQLDAKLETIAPWSWHFDNKHLDIELLRGLRDAGVPSLIFTVNDGARARQLKRLGAAGIFTDYPSKLAQID